MLDKIRYWIWVCNSYLPGKITIASNEKAAVILTYFSKERIIHAKHMVRSLFRCNFINKIVVTNHNPAIDVFQWINIKDTRLKLYNNNETKRGPGFRWLVADTVDSDYFIIIDDDFLIYPEQLAVLFRNLIEDPDIPHGLSGKQSIEGEFYIRKNIQVDILSQLYAVTRNHIKKYMEIADAVRRQYPDIFPHIEELADDIIISMTGTSRPRIHDVGYNLRCSTARGKGVALHQEDSFLGKRLALKKALDKVQALSK